MLEADTRVRRRFDVWNEVPLVPQLTGMSCWAAAAAMVIGWRDRVFVDPQKVASGAGRWESYRDGLHPADVDALALAWGLTQERRETWSPEALRAVLARHGPVWLGEASPGLHSIVVAGMHGDGTPDGTFVRINDPWPVGRGERYTLPWRTLAENFRAASDLIGVQAHVLHAGGRRGSTRSRVEESRVTRARVTPSAPPTREEAMIYHGNGRWHHEEYESVFGGPVSSALAGTAPGERYLDTTRSGGSDPLRGHGGTGENLYLVWNALPEDCAEIDVVVHLHGFQTMAPDAALTRRKAQKSGLRLAARTRPTLGIVPRGRKITQREIDEARTRHPDRRPPNPARYTFPALLAGEGQGLEALVDYALAWLAREVLRRPSGAPRIARRILTAHSGGGAPLNALLGWRARRPACNPHEVHVFDALYGPAPHLAAWARERIAADRALPAAALAAQGGGARILHGGGDTRPHSEAVGRGLPAAGDPLHRAYRVELTRVAHGEVPSASGPVLLGDVRADVPLSAAPRLAPSRGHAVDDDAYVPEEVEHEPQPAYAGDAYGAVAEALAVDDDVRAWLAAAPAARAPLAASVAAWIADLSRSGIDLIGSASRRRHFLRGVDWTRVDFPGNDQKRDAESRALFSAMAGAVPERRVTRLRHHDVERVLQIVPDEGRHRLHPEAKDAYVRMRDAARADGVALRIGSSYRSLATQQRLAARNRNPNAVAQRISAHCYGLAVDLHLSAPGLRVSEITTRPFTNVVAMYRSPVYKWMALRAREFGFFPYRMEPWHWEYNPDGFGARFEAEGRGAAAQAYGAPLGLFERYPSSDALGVVETAPAAVPLFHDDGAFALQAAAPDWCTLGQTIATIALREERDWTRPNGTKLTEGDPGRQAVLQRYWSAVPGVNAAAAAAHSAADHPHWPWSAAFICSVMSQAGVRAAHGFVFAGAHIHYVVGALRNRNRSDRTRPFWLMDAIEIVNEATVRPGDILCMNRRANGTMTRHSYDSLRRAYWGSPARESARPAGSSHCTLVVRVVEDGGRRFAETVGGNEGGSVRLNRYGRIPLNAGGGIANPAAHDIFAMIRNVGCRT